MISDVIIATADAVAMSVMLQMVYVGIIKLVKDATNK